MSFQIAKVKGIPVRLHFTLLIVFFLIAWTLSSGFMPDLIPGLTSSTYWLMGSIGAVVLFVSVFLHELTHSLVAISYGMKVRQIVLFIFGGVSEIAEETRDIRKEFKIAIAGPLMSFAIAAGLGALWWALTLIPTTSIDQVPGTPFPLVEVVKGIALYGGIINALLGAFNLIPAFPLDGGRILRAGLQKWKKDYDSATTISARVGIAISYVFMGVGFLIMLSGSLISGIWLLLIGWFLNSGAQSYLSQHRLLASLENVRLRHLMNTNIVSVDKRSSILDVISNTFGPFMKSSLPVVEGDKLVGMLTVKAVQSLPEEDRSRVRVEELMIPPSDLLVLPPDKLAVDALKRMMTTKNGKVFVCDAQGRLQGIVSKTDILNVANERQEFSKALRSSATKDSAA